MDAYGASANPGGQNADTGSEDVNKGAEVGEGSNAVAAVSGTDGEGSGLRGGRDVGSVLGLVTSSDSEEQTSRHSVGNSAVDGSRLATTKRHAADGTSAAASASLLVVGSEVDASKDTRVGAGALGVKDLDSVKVGLLGYTIGLGANGTSAVGTVTVAVGGLAVSREVLEPGSTCSKLVQTL